MLVVNSNATAAVTQNALVKTGREMHTALEQLSTGVRINGAEDDAAGLAITSRMTSQVIGLSTGISAAGGNSDASVASTSIPPPSPKDAVMSEPWPAWTAIGCTDLAFPHGLAEVKVTAVDQA